MCALFNTPPSTQPPCGLQHAVSVYGSTEHSTSLNPPTIHYKSHPSPFKPIQSPFNPIQSYETRSGAKACTDLTLASCELPAGMLTLLAPWQPSRNIHHKYSPTHPQSIINPTSHQLSQDGLSDGRIRFKDGIQQALSCVTRLSVWLLGVLCNISHDSAIDHTMLFCVWCSICCTHLLTCCAS